MTKTVTKGQLGRDDINFGSGTFSRVTSTGGTQNINRFPVDSTGIASGHLIPIATKNDLGSTSLLWDAFLDTVTAGVWNSVRVVGSNKYPLTEAGFNSAVSDSSSGDTIYVMPGVLSITTGITVSKRLRITGSPSTGHGTGDGSGTDVGSVLSGSGITILTLQANGAVVEHCVIRDPTGNTSTIGIDINNGATGVQNWRLSGMTFQGRSNPGKLGIGLRTVYGLKGVVENSSIEGWATGIQLTASGALKSNGNLFSGNKVRQNTTGYDIPSTGLDTIDLVGETIEGNDTGISFAGGRLTLQGSHLENNTGGTPTNVSISGGNFVSLGNFYSSAAANRDIFISAGAGRHLSYGDVINDGITNNGTGSIQVFQPLVNPSTTGTGSILQFRDGTFTGANVFLLDETRIKRLRATQATAHVVGDYALSAGWGTTASVGSIRGNDQYHEFVITSAGTGQGANPTLTLTYKDLTWTTAPIVRCSRQEFANQPTVTFTVTTQTATTYVLTFNGTPVAAETYKVACFVGGI